MIFRIEVNQSYACLSLHCRSTPSESLLEQLEPEQEVGHQPELAAAGATAAGARSRAHATRFAVPRTLSVPLERQVTAVAAQSNVQ